MAREKTKKKGSAFWRFYRTLLLLIIFALAAVFIYVRGVMIEYEKSQPDNYVVNLFKHAGKSDKALGQYLQENCFGENSDNAIYGDPAKRSADFYNTVAFSDLETTLDLRNYDAEAPTYSVTVDGKPFASVRIKKGESKNKLGILNISKWSFDSIVLQNPEEEDASVEFNENGKFDYTLVMPADFVLKVDGVEVKSFPNAEETVLPEFENMIFFPDVPKGQKITLKDLCFEPVVTVENNEGKEVSITRENGVYYAVDVENGQKTGFFLDQKYNRLAVMRLAKGKRVLDCFTHTGSFALNAALGGAEKVTAVDISASAVEMARKNAERNGLQDRMEFVTADVFDLLPELIEKGGHPYDLIILDPPAFTKSRKTISNAEKGYKEINFRALKLLPRGGYFATASCSHFMSAPQFEKMLRSAARDAGVELKQIEARQQAPDHPILWNVPETDYLKFYLFQVV